MAELEITIKIETSFPDRALLAGVVGTELFQGISSMFTEEAQEGISFAFSGFKDMGSELPSKEELSKIFVPGLVEYILNNNPRTNAECMHPESAMAQILDANEKMSGEATEPAALDEIEHLVDRLDTCVSGMEADLERESDEHQAD